MKTIARRVAWIVETYSGESGWPRSAGVRLFEGRTSAVKADFSLRAAVAKRGGLLGMIVTALSSGYQCGAIAGAGEGESTSGAWPPETECSGPGGSHAVMTTINGSRHRVLPPVGGNEWFMVEFIIIQRKSTNEDACKAI